MEKSEEEGGGIGIKMKNCRLDGVGPGRLTGGLLTFTWENHWLFLSPEMARSDCALS